MSTRIMGIVAFLCGLFSAGCNHKNSRPTENPSRIAPSDPTLQRRLNTSSKPVDKRLISGYNEFGFRLLRDLHNRDKTNVVISPYSIATALAMLNNGARNESQREVSSALEIEALSLQQQNDSNAALHDELLLGTSPTTLKVANALWVQQGETFDQTFLSNLQHYFDAETSQLNFKAPSAVDAINHWANEKTNGMIPKILQELDPLSVIVLGNAVYFKGKWQKPFEKSKTKDGDFHPLNGQITRVSMMSQGGKYLYFAENSDTKKEGQIGLQAVILPYSDKRLRLCLFLPAEGQSLDKLIAQLNNKNWQRWMKQFSSQEGTVSLPRFKTRYHTALIGPFQKQGIKQLFQQGKADLTGMSQRKDLYISQVVHESVVDVNEEGTEAAAVTIIGETGAARSVGPPPFQFVADRPFLFVLHDSQTDTILFLGAVQNLE